MLTYTEYTGELPYPSESVLINFYVQSVRKVSRSWILHMFTLCARPLLTGIPKELLGKDLIVVEGNDAELEAIHGLDQPNYTLYVDHEYTKFTEKLEYVDAKPNYYVYGIGELDGHTVLYLLCDSGTDNYLFPGLEFMLQPGMIENYTDSEPMLTDVGKFLLNYTILVQSCGSYIPYINKKWKTGELDKLVADGIVAGDLTRENYSKFIEWVYFLLSDCTPFMPTWSEESLYTSKKIIQRKNELMEQYKEVLKNPDPVVLAKIEKELVNMDKDFIRGTDSEAFSFATEGKTFNEARRKQHIFFGLAPDFQKNSGAYVFTDKSLQEGFGPENMELLANMIRRGSYMRGMRTADGGVELKFILRIFADSKIIEEDCGSKSGIRMILTENIANLYINRWTTDGVLLTKENISKYIGKEIVLRSPMHCKSKDGNFCYRCIGDLFKKIDIKNVGLMALYMPTKFTSVSMKAFHKTSVSSTKVTEIVPYLIPSSDQRVIV